MRDKRQMRRRRLQVSLAYFFVVLLPLSAGMMILGRGIPPLPHPDLPWILLGVLLGFLSLASPFLAVWFGGYLKGRFGTYMNPQELDFSIVLIGFSLVTLLCLSAGYLTYKLSGNFFLGVFFLILGLLGALFFLLGLKRYEG